MTPISAIIRLVLALMLVSAPLVHAASAQDSGEALFVNLTSDDTDRAVMAIGFAARVREQRKIPVTVFLNVDAVRLADKSIPQARHPNGDRPADMIAKLVASGGKVIICPMCMANVGGMEKADLIENVTVAGPDVTFPALFAKGTTVLSY